MPIHSRGQRPESSKESKLIPMPTPGLAQGLVEQFGYIATKPLQRILPVFFIGIGVSLQPPARRKPGADCARRVVGLNCRQLTTYQGARDARALRTVDRQIARADQGEGGSRQTGCGDKIAARRTPGQDPRSRHRFLCRVWSHGADSCSCRRLWRGATASLSVLPIEVATARRGLSGSYRCTLQSGLDDPAQRSFSSARSTVDRFLSELLFHGVDPEVAAPLSVRLACRGSYGSRLQRCDRPSADGNDRGRGGGRARNRASARSAADPRARLGATWSDLAFCDPPSRLWREPRGISRGDSGSVCPTVYSRFFGHGRRGASG